MDKRGFLLAEETVKIIIAAIGLVFLFALLGKLYYDYQMDQDVEQAKSTLERLILEMNAGAESFQIFNPTTIMGKTIKGVDYWVLISWDKNNNKIPNKCSNFGWENCLCICKNVWVGTEDRYVRKCDDIGICRKSSKVVVKEKGQTSQTPLGITNPPINLKIEYKDSETIITKQ